MKKLVKRIVSLVLVACSLFSMTSCMQMFCSHTNYTCVTTQQMTCTTPGINEYRCNACGATREETYSMPELSASEVYKNSKNSVGEIITYNKRGEELALGTGFVASGDGQIVTNYHVIKGAYSIKISLAGMNHTVQSVLAYDKDIDLAVLKINANGLTALTPCINEHGVGKPVYALGSFRGLTATFSQGIITASDREIAGVHYVQHDAAISSGNSGGPLINSYGEVIGINTMMIKDAQNLNFAVSVRELSNLVFGTPLTVAEFYDKECNAFAIMKNYAMQKGEYDASSSMYLAQLARRYTATGVEITTMIVYYGADDMVALALQYGTTYMFMIGIMETNGAYVWANVLADGDFMGGRLHANTYTSTTTLSYDETTITSSTKKSSVLNDSSKLARMLIGYIDADLKEVGITAKDLGFINY